MNRGRGMIGNYELTRLVAALPPSVSGTDRLLLHTLIVHRNAQTGGCFPTFQTLAREMCASVRTVKYSAARLAAAGLLEIGKRKTRDGNGNTYTLNLSPIGATVAPTNGASDGATVAPTNNGRRCNPQPQTVQSATADGATVAPEQINEQIIKTTTLHASTRARARVAAADAENATDDYPKIRDALYEAAERLGVPFDFLIETAISWGNAGWRTSKGIPITARNAEKLLRSWWEHADQELYRDEGRKATG